MKPFIHARLSVRRYGGVPEDYMPIHDFMDSSKITYADMRHRALLHNSFGIYLAERVFGTYITNADGRQVSVRDVAEDHVKEDCGCIPTPERWLQSIEYEPWMSGGVKKYQNKFIQIEDEPKVD